MTVIWDETGSLVPQDVFFCPVLRRHCSFQDLCHEITLNKINWEGELLILQFGHGQIFRLSQQQVQQEIIKLMAAIWARSMETHVFISTLIPMPVNARINQALEALVTTWMQEGKQVTLLPSHLVFWKLEWQLDHRTGLFVQRYEYIDQGVNFTGNKININGWFKLRNFRLQELRLSHTQGNLVRDWRDVCHGALGDMETLRGDANDWSPPSLQVCIDKSMERE